MKKLFMLMILDGFGIAPAGPGNAVAKAYKPNLDEIFSKYPHTQLKASGLAVGLPEGQMGNSEVGHLNIGAGRVVYQELTRISKAIDDGVFAGNAALNDAINHCRETGGALHVMGLLSDGGVHSHISHIKAVVSLAFSHNVSPIYVHCFMDGRDVPPTSGINYIKEMENFLSDIDGASTGVVAGRYYAMDRDKRWERVKLAYDALVSGQGRRASSGSQAVAMAYEAGETDEFILPTVCSDKARVKDGDSIIFCNFRPDRARELTRCFVDDDFSGFERPRKIADLKYVCMTQYDAEMPNVQVAFSPQELVNTFGEYISNLAMKQLRIAETEKYAHVTFFFNGGVETPFPGEDRILVNSPKVATYDLQPEMSAYEVTDRLLEKLQSNPYDVIILNFANCDMVGHTGVFEAAVKAVEAVDTCVGKLVDRVTELGGVTMVTADHGNADKMIAEDGGPFTAHTTNPVPFCVVGYPCTLRETGCLADIAPTMLKVMNVPQPKEMTGNSLIL